MKLPGLAGRGWAEGSPSPFACKGGNRADALHMSIAQNMNEAEQC